MYCRKSTESEDRQVLSIESQIKELTDLADRMNIRVTEILTESQSAKRQGRPVFNAMIKKVLQGRVNGIITWKLDRLARNPMDGARIITAFDDNKLREIITPGNTFRNTSNDKVSMSIDFCMAKKYVDDLSDNVRRGNKTKLENGWLPGRAPLGYLNEPIERTIVPDPERFPIIRKMWDLLLKGTSPYRIRQIANNDWGLKTRKTKRTGNNPITQSEIYKIFGNPFYYGLIRRKEGIYPGRHKKMIIEDEFLRAQELLGRKGQARPKTHQFAFTGLIRCGECGCSITAEEKDNFYGDHYVYYRCTKKKDGVRCGQKYMNVVELEKQISEYLDRIYVPDKLLAVASELIKESLKEENEKKAAIKASLENSIQSCIKRLCNLNQMRLNDLIDDEEYALEKKALLEEKIGLEHKRKSDQLSDLLTEAKDTLSFANSAKSRFQKGTINVKREIMQRIGSNFLLKDQKLLIQPTKPILILEKTIIGLYDKKTALELTRKGAAKPIIESYCREFC